MSTESQFESPEFRQHIRALLYEYSVTHYTTDYIAFTESLVSELLQDLKPVPLTDPYSFVIPVDPFQTFSQTHNLSSLPPYDEILQTTHEARLYLKNVMHSTRGVAKTARLEWTEAAYDLLNDPFFPALTRHSRNQTPKLGKGSLGPRKFSTLAKVHKLESVAVKPVIEEKLDFEGIMKVKHHINPSDLSAVQAVLKKTADTIRHIPSYKNRYLDHQFLCNIVLKPPKAPEEQFMPIFPRSRHPGSGATNQVHRLPVMKSFAELPVALDNKVKVENIDGDLSMQNLVLVSGWQAIQSSPPSTSSNRDSDSEDQRDQLFFPSSPDTEPPLVEEIEKTKMEVLIPRSRQIGGTSGIVPHILAGKTLQTFLQPLLIPTKNQHGHVLKPELDVGERQKLNPSPTPSSLVGQAASEIETLSAKGSTVENIHERPLEDEIKRLYKGPPWEEAILNEPLDDKQDLLMEIPTLPEPNVHPPGDMDIPKTYAGFLVPSTGISKHETNPAFIKPEPAFQFLKKVKGKQALALALSWVPFTVDKKLPSVVELVGVDDLFERNDSLNDGQFCRDVAEAEKLLESLGLSLRDNRRRFSWTEQTSYRPVAPPEEFHLLLNRQERRRIADPRLSPDIVDMEPVGEMDVDEIPQIREVVLRRGPDIGQDVPQSSPSVKRQHGPPAPGEDVEIADARDGERVTKRPRLEVYYESSPLEPNNVHPLLSAYGEQEYGRVDSGYQSPGSFFMEEDKENWPPFSSSSQVMHDEYVQDQLGGDVQYDSYMVGNEEQDDGGSFEPLSFDSRYLPSGVVKEMQEVDYDPEEAPNPRQDTNFSNQIDVATKDSDGTSMNAQDEFLFEPDIASHSLGISAFAQLRARKVSVPIVPSSPVLAPVPPPAKNAIHSFRGAPEELFDKDTIVISGPIAAELPVHRYMASLDLIQKHGLVRALRSEECAIELIERETLGGVDLILDPYCAVLFISLFTLPARCAADVERVANQSWKFSHLLVVFEAYPESCSKRFVVDKGRDGTVSELYAYTPPILKAIKKFRRDVNIADACGTKRSGTVIQYSFADSVGDAAQAARLFGCQAEERDETFGIIWTERPWLCAEFIESEEQLLAGLDGMNHFSASMILSQVTLQQYGQLLPEERMEVCSGLLAEEVLARCSADIERRFQAMSSSSDL